FHRGGGCSPRRGFRRSQPARIERRVRDAHDGRSPRAPGRSPRRGAHPRGPRRERGVAGRAQCGGDCGARALARARAGPSSMSFRSILRYIVEECGGGLGAVLMGADGIAIEEYVTDRIPEGPLQEDIGSAGIEFSRILEEIRKAADALGGGAVNETVVSLARMNLVFRPIDGETFLALVLAADGNLGKARYLIRRHLLAIRQDL